MRETERCTFKPKTNLTSKNDPDQVSSGQRFEDLYRRVQRGAYKEK